MTSRLSFPPDLERIRVDALRFANIGLYRYTLDGTILFLDEGTMGLLELEDGIKTRDELIGKNISDLFERVPSQPSLRSLVQNDGAISDVEYAYRTLNGNERWVYHNAFIDYDEHLGQEVIQVIARDITDLKKTERALKSSEERYRTFAESQSHGLAVIQGDPPILVYSNSALRRILGVGNQEIDNWPARNVLAFVHPAERKRLADETQMLLDHLREGSMIDLRLRTVDGITRWATTNLSLIEFEGREAIQYVVLDTTEQKLREARQRALEGRLQHGQKLESLGILAGGIAHDFNNLLSTILASADLAVFKGCPDPELEDCLTTIIEASSRGAGLCRQLLNYAGRGEPTSECLGLNELIHEMDRLLDVSVPKKIEIRHEMAENLPWIAGDRTQLGQVVMNLITNSAEAIGNNEGILTIRTGSLQYTAKELEDFNLGNHLEPGEFVFLEVIDTGVGMDAATAARIFDPFFTTKSTGRGLGLAAVLGIVKRHNGAFKVTSEIDAGTQFRIIFPATASLPDTEIQPELSEFNEIGGFALVAEDDAAFLERISQMLAGLGFGVFRARDGREALATIAEQRQSISVVILDVIMPGLNGLEVLEEIRVHRLDIPVLLMSGYDRDSFTTEISKFDAVDFLEKPFRIKTLEEKLRAVLQARED